MHTWRPGEDITAARLRSGYASGTANVTFTVEVTDSGDNFAQNYWRGSVDVTFPAGRFTTPPAVALASSTTVPGVFLEASAVNITATGFQIRAARTSNSATPVCWIAIEES